jgi:hypothetical protein
MVCVQNKGLPKKKRLAELCMPGGAYARQISCEHGRTKARYV